MCLYWYTLSEAGVQAGSLSSLQSESELLLSSSKERAHAKFSHVSFAAILVLLWHTTSPSFLCSVESVLLLFRLPRLSPDRCVDLFLLSICCLFCPFKLIFIFSHVSDQVILTNIFFASALAVITSQKPKPSVRRDSSVTQRVSNEPSVRHRTSDFSRRKKG